MSEKYVPQKGDLLWDLACGEGGMVAGWLDEDMFVVVRIRDRKLYIRDYYPSEISLIAKSGEIKPGKIRIDETEVGEITVEEIEELKKLLPTQITLKETRPT